MNEFSVEYIAVCRHHAVALSQAISHAAAAAAAAAVADLQSNSWLLISLRLTMIVFSPYARRHRTVGIYSGTTGAGGHVPPHFFE